MLASGRPSGAVGIVRPWDPLAHNRPMRRSNRRPPSWRSSPTASATIGLGSLASPPRSWERRETTSSPPFTRPNGNYALPNVGSSGLPGRRGSDRPRRRASPTERHETATKSDTEKRRRPLVEGPSLRRGQEADPGRRSKPGGGNLVVNPTIHPLLAVTMAGVSGISSKCVSGISSEGVSEGV